MNDEVRSLIVHRSSFIVHRLMMLLGRFCQLTGMVLLPIGLYCGLVRNDIRTEVMLLAIGGCVYLIGWLLAKK